MVFLCDLQYGDEFYWNSNLYRHATPFLLKSPSIVVVQRVSDGQEIKLRSHTEVEYV